MNTQVIDVTEDHEGTMFENLCFEFETELKDSENERKLMCLNEYKQDFMHIFGRNCIANGISLDYRPGAMVKIDAEKKCITCDTCFGRSVRGKK